MQCLITEAQLPNTEVWLFRLEKTKTGTVLTSPLNISNREGYDNQPTFSADAKKVYYTSIREDKQADIYTYTIASKKTTQFTKTAISEYSPSENKEGTFLHAVVVEKDSAQRVHGIQTVSGIHEKIIDLDSVGYYCFLNADTMVYYKLTNPHSLHVYSQKKNESRFIAYSPIRGFKPINRHTLLFGIKDSIKVDYYTYSFVLHKAEKYATYPSISEDIVWHPKLGLVKSEGTQLLRYDELTKQWLVFYDFKSFGLHKITRFAFDPLDKYLVIVDNL